MLVELAFNTIRALDKIYHFQYQKENRPNYLKSAAMGFFSLGLKHEFETAVVNEQSVFKLLKFCCIYSLRA